MTHAPAIRGTHHVAYRCRDAEQTRQFYEDILGLPLKASLVFDEEPGTGRPLPYMHLFFQMGDGRFVAFFDVPDRVTPDKFRPRWGMDLHLAFEVDGPEALEAFRTRISAAGVTVFGPIDHHFVHSIYFYDPNGINLEITYRDAAHDRIMAEEGSQARALMDRWTERTRPAKHQAGVLDPPGASG
jgi:catechol 2,3-dioxygenase-like lactoylglutathione lyase family enzyme